MRFLAIRSSSTERYVTRRPETSTVTTGGYGGLMFDRSVSVKAKRARPDGMTSAIKHPLPVAF